MIRRLLMGTAALTLMSSAAFAQDYRDRDDQPTVVVYSHPHPAERAVGGGVVGAGIGAAIGCLVTLPICAPGAAVGAAIGGGTGAVAGVATTPSRDYYYRAPRDDYPPPAGD
jgi:hypothetical protein